ncbi:MAG: tetratricopeptide repeat protein, partial [Nitrospinota bacterium]
MAGKEGPLRKAPHIWLPLLIFSLAFLLRLIYILEIRGSPFWDTFILDQEWYDQWAQEIAGGHWVGKEVFFLNPLYAYFLGLIYLPAGRALLAVRLIQAAMGGLSCCLIWAIGRRLFGGREAVLAGLLGATYGLFIFYDSVLAVASLATFLNLLLVFYLLRTDAGAGKREGLIAGVLLGLSVLARPNVLLFYPFLAAFWFLKLRPRKAFLAGAMSLLGAALVVSPVALRHLIVAGDFVPFTSSGGINLFIGNNPKADGTFMAPSGVRPEPRAMLEDSTRLAEEALGRKLKASEVSAYWQRRAMRFWREEPGKALFLYLKKLALFWNGQELGGTYNFPYFKGRSSSLRNNPVSFGLLAPLALLGMGVFLRRFKELLLPYGMLFTYTFGIALVFVVAQYRVAAVPFALLFASAFIFWAVGKIRELRLKPLILAAAVGAPLALGVNYPMVGGTLSVAHTNMGVLYDLRGLKGEAEREFREALRLDPENIRALNNLAIIHEERGELKRALSLYQRAVALRPDYFEGRANYASALLRIGRFSEGLAEFQALLMERPRFAPAYLSFSSALL